LSELAKKEKTEALAQVELANQMMIAIGKEPAVNQVSSALVLLDNRALEAKEFMRKEVRFATYKRGENKGKSKVAGALGGARADADAHAEGFEHGKNVQLRTGMNQGAATPKLGK